jgi:GDSL-like lipase/acylhydrolase family protein
MIRHGLTALLTAAVLVAIAPAASADRDRGWVATWGTVAHPLGPLPDGSPFPSGFDGQSVRNIVHVSAGGRAVRLRLTNRYGDQPVRLDAVHVGIQREGAALVPGSDRVVTFSGRRSVLIPDHADALSDPVSLTVAPRQNLAISVHAAHPVPMPTAHWFPLQTNYVSGVGDFTADTDGRAYSTTVSVWYFVDQVDVLASGAKGAIVALGDSITDGANSTANTNRRWPDVLAGRLLDGPRSGLKSVVNSGLAGNNVHESSLCFGENAVARLGRDVFARSGATDVIFLEGINDITHPETPEPRFPCLTKIPISADDLIGLYEQVIARAHAHGLRIYGGTLTPSVGYGPFTPAM